MAGAKIVSLRGDLGASARLRDRQAVAVNLAAMLRRGFVAVGDKAVTVTFATQLEADQCARMLLDNKRRR